MPLKLISATYDNSNFLKSYNCVYSQAARSAILDKEKITQLKRGLKLRDGIKLSPTFDSELIHRHQLAFREK